MVIWKNRNFRDLGIIVETTPQLSKANKKINIFEIPGRSGFLSEDDGTYEPFALSVECHAKEGANFDEICEYLDGFGTLSFNGKRQYTAIINNAIPFEKILMFKKFVVQFLVNPICEDIEETSHEILEDNSTLTINDTYYGIEPKIILNCNGNISITINGQTIYLDNTNGTYILDCKNKLITQDGVNTSNIMIGDFPKLIKGDNLISYTGDITNFKIDYKKTYLWGGGTS